MFDRAQFTVAATAAAAATAKKLIFFLLPDNSGNECGDVDTCVTAHRATTDSRTIEVFYAV